MARAYRLMQQAVSLEDHPLDRPSERCFLSRKGRKFFPRMARTARCDTLRVICLLCIVSLYSYGLPASAQQNAAGTGGVNGGTGFAAGGGIGGHGGGAGYGAGTFGRNQVGGSNSFGGFRGGGWGARVYGWGGSNGGWNNRIFDNNAARPYYHGRRGGQGYW